LYESIAHLNVPIFLILVAQTAGLTERARTFPVFRLTAGKASTILGGAMHTADQQYREMLGFTTKARLYNKVPKDLRYTG
jgi:hypothetical protein